MKTKEEYLWQIEQVVLQLGYTSRGGGRFLSYDDIDAFWIRIRDACGLRMVSPSSFDGGVVRDIFMTYTRRRKWKGYDCACEIAQNMFKTCDSTAIMVLFKTPFEANFKKTSHGNLFMKQGYSIRNAHISDFAGACADCIISLGLGTGVASDLEERIFHLFNTHKHIDNDQDLAQALVDDLKKLLHMD